LVFGLLNRAAAGGTINGIMIDIQHDSPVPIHEQITGQLRSHIATGALQAGARLAEYRALAQQLLTNPQVVARAYGDLEWEGVLRRDPSGGMEVTAGAAVICRVRLQDAARRRLAEAVAQGLAAGLPEAEVVKAVEQALATAKARPLSPDELKQAIQKPTHASSHRALQGVQDLSRQEGAGPPQPQRPGGGDIRPARG
jgi:GntR family transcriptional regulator